jgi:hypothetical protein
MNKFLKSKVIPPMKTSYFQMIQKYKNYIISLLHKNINHFKLRASINIKV